MRNHVKTILIVFTLLSSFSVFRFFVHRNNEISNYDIYVAIPILIGFIFGTFFLNCWRK
jgi:hypothetical protein